GLERLVFRWSEIGVFVEVEADAMTDEGDWRQIKLAEFAEIEVVDRAARRAGLDSVEEEIFAGGEGWPDGFSLRGRHPDRSGCAHAGMIAADHRKYFDATNIAVPEHTIGRTNIREDAALARRHDHQFEVFGTLLVDPACERRRQVHFARSGAHRMVG